MTDKAMMDGNLQGHRFYGSPYAPNPVCRSLFSLGVKRGFTGAVVYSDGFSVKGLKVSWDAWDRLFPLLSIGRIKHYPDLSLHFLYAQGRKTFIMRPIQRNILHH